MTKYRILAVRELYGDPYLADLYLQHSFSIFGYHIFWMTWDKDSKVKANQIGEYIKYWRKKYDVVDLLVVFEEHNQ